MKTFELYKTLLGTVSAVVFLSTLASSPVLASAANSSDKEQDSPPSSTTPPSEKKNVARIRSQFEKKGSPAVGQNFRTPAQIRAAAEKERADALEAQLRQQQEKAQVDALALQQAQEEKQQETAKRIAEDRQRAISISENALRAELLAERAGTEVGLLTQAVTAAQQAYDTTWKLTAARSSAWDKLEKAKAAETQAKDKERDLKTLAVQANLEARKLKESDILGWDKAAAREAIKASLPPIDVVIPTAVAAPEASGKSWPSLPSLSSILPTWKKAANPEAAPSASAAHNEAAAGGEEAVPSAVPTESEQSHTADAAAEANTLT